MTRTISKTQKKHKKIIKLNKGFVGSHSKLFKVANQENIKSLVYSYKNRKIKKRTMKQIWIKKINNKIKETNFKNYSYLTNFLKNNKILINKKILSKLLEKDSEILNIFGKI